MELVYDYVSLLPDLNNAMLSFLPTISYFISVKFYSYFQKKNTNPVDILDVKKSSKHMILSSVGNIFISYPIYNYFSEGNLFSILNVLIGMVLLDTYQYFSHRFYHSDSYIYSLLHKEHHSQKQISPETSFAHGDIVVTLDSIFVISMFIYFKIIFTEYIIILSLSFVSNVSDHTYTSKNKFHYIHHHVNINRNFQAPFFTYWDHIFGTYHKDTELKIPFVP